MQKCKFNQLEVSFLGHKLSGKGVLPTDDKVKSLLQCRPPRSKEELRSFLGLATYVSRFIPDLASTNHPLRELIKTSVNFRWEKIHQDSFEELKKRMASMQHLAFFDPKDRTLLVTDASGVGLGAVLIQFKNGVPRVISYASKSLTDTEKHYPPIEKETLAIVWGVERFQMYLLGVSFTVETDHRPLETLFTAKSRPTARIEKWLLRLLAFRFTVIYRKGSSNIADPISRLAAQGYDDNWTEETEVFIRRVMVESLAALVDERIAEDFNNDTDLHIRTVQEAAAIDISEVVDATDKDTELQFVKEAIMNGDWSKDVLRPYSAFRSELSYVNELIIRGSKLVIPAALRARMLSLAHEGHPGQTCMKRRLRDRCWWPNMDKEIVSECERCEGCRLVQIPSPPEPMERRPLPEKPWLDLAIDFLGPMPTGEHILVVIDYYSRFVELVVMKNITAKDTINSLTKIFRVWGVPKTITLDNAKQFVSSEFSDFCKLKGIHLNHTSPYWPQANGEVERQNRSLLKRLKIANALYGSWKAEMDRYLEMYNNTPHSVTGKAPSELLQNRRLRFKFPDLEDLSSFPLESEVADRDKISKTKGKEKEDARRKAKYSDIEVGDEVLMRNLHPTNKLSTDFLKEKFVVEDRNRSNVRVKSLESNKSYDRNVSHLKKVLGSHTEQEEHNQDVDGATESKVDQRRSVRTRQIPSRYQI